VYRSEWPLLFVPPDTPFPYFEDGLGLAFIFFSRQVDIHMYGAFKKAFV
jgi:hypothetical protein